MLLGDIIIIIDMVSYKIEIENTKNRNKKYLVI